LKPRAHGGARLPKSPFQSLPTPPAFCDARRVFTVRRNVFMFTLKSSIRYGLVAAAALAIGLGASSAMAETAKLKNAMASNERSVEVGKLTCTVLPNSRRNYVVRSTAQVDCVYTPLKGEKETYKGTTGIQLGIDLTVREDEKLRFAVFSSRKKGDPRPEYALEGKYFGASATASFTYGLGTAALIGGSSKEISLQPVGIETLRGLGLGAGLGFLYIERMSAS